LRLNAAGLFAGRRARRRVASSVGWAVAWALRRQHPVGGGRVARSSVAWRSPLVCRVLGIALVACVCRTKSIILKYSRNPGGPVCAVWMWHMPCRVWYVVCVMCVLRFGSLCLSLHVITKKKGLSGSNNEIRYIYITKTRLSRGTAKRLKFYEDEHTTDSTHYVRFGSTYTRDTYRRTNTSRISHRIRLPIHTPIRISKYTKTAYAGEYGTEYSIRHAAMFNIVTAPLGARDDPR
jgi:hypothetical protein